MSQWLDSPGWMRDAECHLEPGLPWTADFDQIKGYEVHAMATVCARCPVLDECRDYAAENTDLWGFWAGETRPGTVNKPGRQRARPNDTDLILATQTALAPALDEGPGDISEAKASHGLDNRDDLDDLDDSDRPDDVDDTGGDWDELGDEVSDDGLRVGAADTPVTWVRDPSVTTGEAPGGVSGWFQPATIQTAVDQAPIGVGSLVGLAGQLNEAMAVYEHAVRVDGIGAASTTGARVGFLVAVEHLYRYAKAAGNVANNAAATQTAESRGAA